MNKGYHAIDIIEQCGKLTEAGIDFWMSFLNGVAGKEHSMDHAIHSAEIFSQCDPMLVGTGGLVLFPGTPLLDEAGKGEFTPLSEKELGGKTGSSRRLTRRSSTVIWTDWLRSEGTRGHFDER